MRTTVLFVVALPLLAPLRPSFAQQVDALVGEAIASSPLGALTPLMSPSMIGRSLDGAQLGLRYGFRRDSDIDLDTYGIAASAIFSLGLKSSMSITAGVRDSDCDGCTPRLLLGAAGDMRVYETSEFVGNGSGIAVSVSGELGYGSAFGETDAFVLGIGAPLTASFATGDRDALKIVPFFTPVFGIGQTDCPTGQPGCDNSGTRLVLGGGVGVWNPMTNISASLGANRVMQEGEKTVFGVTVVLGGGR
jgi:hypothetical protein